MRTNGLVLLLGILFRLRIAHAVGPEEVLGLGKNLNNVLETVDEGKTVVNWLSNTGKEIEGTSFRPFKSSASSWQRAATVLGLRSRESRLDELAHEQINAEKDLVWHLPYNNHDDIMRYESAIKHMREERIKLGAKQATYTPQLVPAYRRINEAALLIKEGASAAEQAKASEYINQIRQSITMAGFELNDLRNAANGLIGGLPQESIVPFLIKEHEKDIAVAESGRKRLENSALEFFSSGGSDH